MMVTVEQEETIHELSQNEARVLHSLVKWPEASDQEIHQKINIKKSTFSSIKTRLNEQGYYKKYFIPNFPKIGFELFMVMFGNLNRYTNFEERWRIAGDTIKSFKEDFHVLSESNKAFNLSVAQNYTEYTKNIETFFNIYSENNFLTKEGMNIQAFPFQISRFHSFLDYESLLAKIFNFTSESYGNRIIMPPGGTEIVKLTRAERKVLVGLIKYSDETDTLIAEEVGVSRNTVANAKHKFMKKKICFARIVPDIKQLGMKILVFNYRKFNPKITMDDRKDATQKVRALMAPHFYISKNLDGFLISAHENFEEYNSAYDNLMTYYMGKEYILDEPISYTISVPDMHVIKDIQFLPMVMKIMDFDPEIPLKDQK